MRSRSAGRHARAAVADAHHRAARRRRSQLDARSRRRRSGARSPAGCAPRGAAAAAVHRPALPARAGTELGADARAFLGRQAGQVDRLDVPSGSLASSRLASSTSSTSASSSAMLRAISRCAGSAGASLQQLQRHPHARQRRAQLVGRVGQQRLVRRTSAFDALGRAVEAAGQQATSSRPRRRRARDSRPRPSARRRAAALRAAASAGARRDRRRAPRPAPRCPAASSSPPGPRHAQPAAVRAGLRRAALRAAANCSDHAPLPSFMRRRCEFAGPGRARGIARASSSLAQARRPALVAASITSRCAAALLARSGASQPAERPAVSTRHGQPPRPARCAGTARSPQARACQLRRQSCCLANT